MRVECRISSVAPGYIVRRYAGGTAHAGFYEPMKKTSRSWQVLVAASVLASAIILSPIAGAQEWPSRPIKILTPLAAGGAADIMGRTVGDALGIRTRQTVIIDNRPGGGGTLAAVQVVHADPDGNTLLLGAAAAMSIGPALTKNMPYDPVADLTPLMLGAELPICLVVNPSLPVKNVAELIAYAKANPGKLSFGSSGPNTTHHLAGEFLKAKAGINMVHVPYRGGNPAMTDLLSGQIPVLFATLSTAIPYIDAGRVRVLGMIEAKRSRTRPEIPTIGETVPGYAMPPSWLGFLAPAKLPPGLAGRIHDELVASINTPNVRKTLEDNGFDIVASTPEEFGQTLKDAVANYRKIAADVGIEPQ
jgi:tripartite-type tricarboxylate transporter receptor subunit TctC